MQNLKRSEVFRPQSTDRRQLNKLSNEQLQTLQQFASDKNAQKVFIAYARLLITCRQILVSTGVLQSTLLLHKEKIIQVLHQIKHTISLNKSLKILSIPRSTYQLWFFKTKFPSTSSLFSMCRKRYIHQLLPKEHTKMEELLRDPQYVHWPIISIAHYARRNNLLTVGISTWYLYAKIMGFKRRVIPNPKKYRIGLKAAFPNQYWHADVTLFDTLNGIRHYIYLVSDNFSRKILAWKVDTQLSAEIRLQTIKEAWNNANDSFSSVQDITLITDGGSENNNAIVNGFIEQHQEHLQKKIALKDIPYSNSSIEAINKTLKYRYLYLQPCKAEQFQSKLQESIHDYNHIRSHGSLNGLTPDEAYISETTPNIKAQMTKAKTERMEKNRTFNCKTCEK